MIKHILVENELNELSEKVIVNVDKRINKRIDK